MIRIVLIDTLGLVRSGVRMLLQSAGDFAVLGEGESAEEALHLARQVQPDVLLLDHAIEGALAVIRTIKSTAPACDVVVLANRLTQIDAQKAFDAGAAGYVCKDIPGDDLLAILHAMRTQGASRPVLASATSPFTIFRAPRVPRGQPNGLTARELEILTELATGGTDTEIALKLHVHEGTVKTHIRNILRKLGVRNRTAAIAHALRERLIE